MEYNLLLEKKEIKTFFYIALSLVILAIPFLFALFGIYGIILLAVSLFFVVSTPLLINKYKLFLFLWLTAYPLSQYLFYNNILNIGGKNVIGLFITGLSLPILVVLFIEKIIPAIKEISFLKFLLLFDLLVFLNFMMPGGSLFSTLQELKAHLTILALILMIHSHLKTNSQESIIKFINIYGILNSVVAVIQGITRKGLIVIGTTPRVKGLTAHPNACGFFINIYLLFCFYMFYNAETKKDKIIWGSIIFVNIIALIFTFSKTSILIMLMNIFVITLFSPISTKIKNFSLSFIFLLLIMLVDLIFNLNLVNLMQSRFENNVSMDWRMDTWKALIGNINVQSFFTGHGIDSSARYLFSIRPDDTPNAHNGYLHLLYEYGILGYLYIGAILSVVFSNLKKIFVMKEFKTKIIYLMPVLFGLTFLLELAFDVATTLRETVFYMWALITMFYIFIHQKEKANNMP